MTLLLAKSFRFKWIDDWNNAELFLPDLVFSHFASFRIINNSKFIYLPISLSIDEYRIDLHEPILSECEYNDICTFYRKFSINNFYTLSLTLSDALLPQNWKIINRRAIVIKQIANQLKPIKNANIY